MIETFKLEQCKLSPHFIGSWIIDNSLCDELIVYFENNKTKQQQGLIGVTASIDIAKKNRTDLRIAPKDMELATHKAFKLYFNNVFKCYKHYSDKWTHLKTIAAHLEIPAFNIGRYEPGQHFNSLHCERAGLGTLHRLFAFMTYLNNVEEGGTTYFDNYNLEIAPKKGLTLIWPAEWTHTHRGNKVIKGTKYMITGWLCFPVDETQLNLQN